MEYMFLVLGGPSGGCGDSQPFPFLFQAERSNKRASEGARLGWANNGEELGRGEVLIFRIRSQFSSLRVLFSKRLLRRLVQKLIFC